MSDPSLPPIVQTPLTTVGSEASESADNGSSQASRPAEGITSSRPLVFGILFGVTGALGLPLLWFSPAFSRNEKWLWTIVNSLYTLGLLAVAIAALKVIFDAFAQLR